MFFTDKKVVALDIGTSSIKLAEIVSSRKGPVLTKFNIAPIDSGMVVGGEIVDTVSVSQAVSGLHKNSRSKRKNAASAMWGTSVIVKKISMPRMDEKLVSEQIKWEAEQYIPFDINEVSLECHILDSKSQSESMDILLVAAKQEYVFRFIEAVESSGLKLAVMDVAGFALANCFEANYGSNNGTVALLNIGAGVTNVVVVDQGDVVFSRDIPIGGQHYTSEINKSMGVSPMEAEALKISASLGQEVPDDVNTIISSANEQVIDEIRTTLEFYAATASGAAPQRFFVSGGSIFIPGLVDQVSRALSLSYEVLDPLQRISFDSKMLSYDYVSQIKAICPIAIGLALRGVGDR